MIRISRRKFLIGAGVAAGTPVALAAWGYDAEHLAVTRRRIAVPGLKGPLRAVQVSDLHADREGSSSEALRKRVAGRVRAEAPDLIFATGDYVTQPGDTAGDAEEAAAWLAGLRSPLGTFAVLGNHDSAGVGQALESRGVTVLRDEWTGVRGMAVAGVGDLSRGPHRPDLAFAGIPKGTGTVLLAHQPDSFWTYAEPVTLQLSGHTHGGQVTLLGTIPVSRLLPHLQATFEHIPKLDRLARRGYRQTSRGAWSGFFGRPDGSTLYVNRGLGRHKRISFYCAPELTVWELIPA